MKMWVSSQGLCARGELLRALWPCEPKRFGNIGQVAQEDLLAGWGNKPTSESLCSVAAAHGHPFWRLEDSFFGYLGHPARSGLPLGLVWDDEGIYYDARTPSRLERLIPRPLSELEQARAEQLTALVRQHGVTKYNIYPGLDAPMQLPPALSSRFGCDSRPCILLVDQVAGDLSITGALADEQTFVAMAAAARARHPGARLLLRTHPDTRLGKKRGALARLNLADLELVSEPCHPHALLRAVDAVYTVSSQMGFEALLLGKPVYCFGMPFYAGWGLTHDALTCERRTQISLEQLVHAALITYPRYYDPVLKQPCEVEEVIRLVAAQLKPAPRWRRLYLVGFSLWKRAFMHTFCVDLADELRFVSKPPVQLAADEQVLVWGRNYPELVSPIRVEDGFIRSRGLGSNLCRPSSLSVDPLGIYFDSTAPSQLERLLNQHPFSPEDQRRGASLLALLRAHRVSKYNVGVQRSWQPAEGSKTCILVVGQVDGDASILTGSPVIRSNEQLLWAVREARPDAHIIYKPHPDVVAGNRAGTISATCLAACVDEQVLEVDLASLYPQVAELHTMTSLSGFEALMQDVRVVVWGQPFYSGWGLTVDVNPPSRRERTLTQEQLALATLALYPRYFDWRSGLWVTAEHQIRLLAAQGQTDSKPLPRLHRWALKLGYLYQTVVRPPLPLLDRQK
ncbi:capsular polysaccharide biosynthesis protein [Pluralibacter sp.]|uniref:capsular polysaccharide biosynthesis protein n=1 Tax=Pluralibacter sp. TaxID=1920032 RepID=UPI0025F893BF|nr:capsular polysaccharide biosynthesis protein [Pluralibacter sp.]MBV8041090.1 capsular polysaccharide biosynthesis protein [Pluralibacter sp.]